MKNDICKAIKILNQGGIAIFPTDTAFAIGCRIDNEKAIQRLFQIRKRPHSQATPVLVDGLDMAQEYLLPVSKEIKEGLIDRYWPGALTIVLPCLKEKVPMLVRGASDNLGVRMPDHQTTLSLIGDVGVPLLGPSANFHGQATPFQFQDLDKDLVKLVDFVIEGECSIKQASTVIDCSIKPWKILRQGAVKLKIMQVILFIDTSDNKEIKVGLIIDGKEYIVKQPLDQKKAQVVLPLIEQLLQKHELTLKDISEIQVNPGPGSFTGIRVGLTIANTLAFLLKIPVNGKPVGEMAEPIY